MWQRKAGEVHRLIPARRFRAPPDNRALLAEPALAGFPTLWQANRDILTSKLVGVAGFSLPAFRVQAQQEILQLARNYLQKYEVAYNLCTQTPLLVTGHQPELFHPGVWVKNILIYRLARQYGLQPLHLIVDNDTLKSSSVRLPVWERFQPSAIELIRLPFDRFEGETPYEDRPVLDHALWQQFPEQLQAATKNWDFIPLAARYWVTLEQSTPAALSVGEHFSALRRQLEHNWGIFNLELPLSHICASRAFAYFLYEIFGDLPRFHDQYNRSVQVYRRVHRIRSRSHPVPDLAMSGAWFEVPLWGWRAGQSRRERVWAQSHGDKLELAFKEAQCELPRESLEAFADAWLAHQHSGLRIRSRALLTTLFARLALADVFIHGIGGGKYDEVTDLLIRGFFQVKPPGFMVVSATLHLPFSHFPADRITVQSLQRQQRRLLWQPYQYLDGQPLASEWDQLVRERTAWVNYTPPDRLGRRERFFQLQALTRSLRPAVADQLAELEHALTEAEHQAHANARLRRRDYSFILYPESYLRMFFDEITTLI